LATVTSASKIVGDNGTSPDATKPAKAAPDIFCTVTSCSAILFRNSRPNVSSTLPTHLTPVEVPAMDILPFHFGSSRSLSDLGTSFGEMSAVVQLRLLYVSRHRGEQNHGVTFPFTSSGSSMRPV